MLAAIADPSQVAEARRRAARCAADAGVPEQRVPEVALAVTELATNLLKHGGGGMILASAFDDADGSGFQVLALDQGRGMTDIDRCMRDGYSTSGSPGTGLGAISRMADLLRIYSRMGRGTAILARFICRPAGAEPRTQFGIAQAPFPGERLCGDAWAFAHPLVGRTLLLVDGAGHGPEAARAADTATAVFRTCPEEPCEALVDRLHRALRPTRGAALAVARIDTAERVIDYAGLGNIAGVLVADGTMRHMVSHNGTAGHLAPRIRAFRYEYVSDPLLIMHSDGLTSRWDMAGYPGLASQHPALIAGVLFRDHRRPRDDATVVVMRVVS